MKQFYFSILLIFGFTSLSIAQNTVTVDASAAQNGYANVFETPANGGGFVFGQAWGVPDLKTVVDASANTLTLQPNYNNWGDGTDGFWVDQGTGLGNKNFEANTYVEDNSLVGSELTFEGSVSSYNISSDYQVLAFIKVFNADFSFLKQENFEIVATGDFSVSYTNVEASDAVVQYGFQVLGLNANPTEEASLGSVIVESTQQELGLPLTFEGGQLPAFGDFNGSSTQVIANPDASGINTTANVAENTVPGGASFAGVGIGVPINLTNDKYFKMQVWSPVANTPVLLKLEGGPPPVERQVTTTTTGAWEEIIFDFSAEGAVEYTTAVIFMNFNVVDGATQTYYWDNLELFTPPPPPGVNLPITFENGDNPNFQDFNGSETEVISNPFPDGLNPSENVAQNIVPGNTSFAGVSFDVSTIDLSLGNTFNLDVRAILPDAPILLKLENTVNGTSIEREIILSTVNEWENITFDFSTEANANYDKVTLFMYFNSPVSINRVAYWDNLKQNLNDLVALPVTFESATADYNVIGFEGADAAVEVNPDPSGINTSNTVVRLTKTEGAAFFAGTAMGLDVPIDFSETESISIKTWSPKADIPVRLKLEGSGGQVMELDVNTTVTNEWETLTWDFSGQTAGVDWLTVVLFFEFVVDLPGDGTTYYYDDIDLAPQIGDLVELPVTFESATADYNVIGFEGADSAVEANPDPSGINTSNTVVRTTKTEGAAFFAGTGMGLDVPIDFSETESISIKTWSPKADIPVRLKLEGPGGEFIELDVNTTVENEWETLTWDFSGQTAGVDWLTVVIFFEFVVDLPGDGSTYYYDDIELAAPLSIGDTVLSTVVSFPNPVKTLWNVQAQETITDIIIYNLFGQKILSISPNMSDVSLNMSEMRTGVYLAHVYSDKGTKIIKILKE